MKKKLKDLEILQKTDPEAALKELEELEKIRAGERASLRHHSTGKWAQNLQVLHKGKLCYCSIFSSFHFVYRIMQASLN